MTMQIHALSLIRHTACYNASTKTGCHKKMTFLLVFTMVFLFPDFHCLSSIELGNSFVFREPNTVIYKRPKILECRGDQLKNMRGMQSCISPSSDAVSKSGISLFSNIITEHGTKAQENFTLDSMNTILSTQQTEVSSSQSKSKFITAIEVVMPKNRTASISTSSSKNVNYLTGSDKVALVGKMKNKSVEKCDDVPRPTANGGYSHTKSSRAKISAANKGKTPWNKGKPRSPEVKARIAAGVRAKNRQVFLEKLEAMGLTEEEFEERKKEERRIKDADRRARRTVNGGYRPTEETKKKISRILKEKHARGEVKRRSKISPEKVRKGFTHSEETRMKISQSLRKRWQDDEGFQKRMKASNNTREKTRKRISESLKKKWQDPEFRNGMIEKMAQRKSGKDAMNYDVEHRKKISEAMKRKWQDASYREKTLTSMKKSVKNRDVVSPINKTSISTTTSMKKRSPEIEEIKPMTVTDLTKRRSTKKRVTRKMSTTKIQMKHDYNCDVGLDDDNISDNVPFVKAGNMPTIKHKNRKKAKISNRASANFKIVSEEKSSTEREKRKDKAGSVTRLKEERRDLFDLLYGDEDDTRDDIDDTIVKSYSIFSSGRVDNLLGDEDLDSFDPYGLDDY